MKTGILLVNLGTPDSPSTADVRTYLREFLSDPRVIDIAPLARWLLVNLIIAPFRASRSAALYRRIWTDEGSPLMVYSLRQQALLQAALGDGYQVELAMRYRHPSLAEVLQRFRHPGVGTLRVLPLFPQYASATTGSVHQEVLEIVRRWEVIPSVELVNSYCNDAAYIRAITESGASHDPASYDHVLMSFHGLPERQIRKSDASGQCLGVGCCDRFADANRFCYRAQCFETARRIAAAFSLDSSRYTVCFQSRLGKTPWIRPYAEDVVRQLAKDGIRRLLVFSPAFTSDCLETVYEIGMEYDQLFRDSGGERLQLVESLNDHPVWIDALKGLATGPLQPAATAPSLP